MRGRKKRWGNSLFFRIVLTVILGAVGLTSLLGLFYVDLSKRLFIKSFQESQEKIFDEIEEHFFEFYGDVNGILEKISGNSMVVQYLAGGEAKDGKEQKTIQGIDSAADNTHLSLHPEWELLLVGEKGKIYLHGQQTGLRWTAEEILKSPLGKKVWDNPEWIESVYRKGGFTDSAKKKPVVMFARGVLSGEKPIGMAVLTIPEADFEKLYGAFTSEASSLLIFNRENELLSSENEADFKKENQEVAKALLQTMEEQGISKMERKMNGRVKSYQIQKFSDDGLKIFGVMDPNAAFVRQYHILTAGWITVGITVLVVAAIFFLVRAQTKPLYTLAETMRKVGKGELEAYVEVQGTDEVRELSRTYNDMISQVNHYIQKLMEMQEEKRKIELHALQMQINPHYMYNTLAGIKWLIWQGNTEKSTQVIDAFISLLRNTISNTDAFITLEQEIENLKNYVRINEIRYGDQIRTEFYISTGCYEKLVPKLILQPFVENAFFHGFPAGRSGVIEIFAREKEGLLWIEIADNGVGVDKERLTAFRQKEKGEHFTGIGINNVEDRIKMIYGGEYGIHIDSQKGRGTTVTIRLPG